MSGGRAGVVVGIVDHARGKSAQAQIGIDDVERGQGHVRHRQMDFGRPVAKPAAGDHRTTAEIDLAGLQSPAPAPFAAFTRQNRAARHGDGIAGIVTRDERDDPVGRERRRALECKARAAPPGERSGDRSRPVDHRDIGHEAPDEHTADGDPLRLKRSVHRRVVAGKQRIQAEFGLPHGNRPDIAEPRRTSVEQDLDRLPARARRTARTFGFSGEMNRAVEPAAGHGQIAVQPRRAQRQRSRHARLEQPHIAERQTHRIIGIRCRRRGQVDRGRQRPQRGGSARRHAITIGRARQRQRDRADPAERPVDLGRARHPAPVVSRRGRKRAIIGMTSGRFGRPAPVAANLPLAGHGDPARRDFDPGDLHRARCAPVQTARDSRRRADNAGQRAIGELAHGAAQVDRQRPRQALAERQHAFGRGVDRAQPGRRQPVRIDPPGQRIAAPAKIALERQITRQRPCGDAPVVARNPVARPGEPPGQRGPGEMRIDPTVACVDPRDMHRQRYVQPPAAPARHARADKAFNPRGIGRQSIQRDMVRDRDVGKRPVEPRGQLAATGIDQTVPRCRQSFGPDQPDNEIEPVEPVGEQIDGALSRGLAERIGQRAAPGDAPGGKRAVKGKVGSIAGELAADPADDQRRMRRQTQRIAPAAIVEHTVGDAPAVALRQHRAMPVGKAPRHRAAPR